MEETFYGAVRAVLNDARATAYRAVNFAITEVYWRIGHLIVEHCRLLSKIENTDVRTWYIIKQNCRPE